MGDKVICCITKNWHFRLLKMKKIKQFLVLLLTLIAGFALYVQIINRDAVNMTYRQKILKAFYPALIWFTRLAGKNKQVIVNEKINPWVSFYSLKGILINEEPYDFARLKGKKVMIVNTASDCGYTNQYADLEKLYRQHRDKLEIIGFPANDFKAQEKGTNEVIAKFCKENYGVSFPLMKKCQVIKGTEQHEIFQWLTNTAKNGWNEQQPNWNFCKYIIDESGRLAYFFGPSVEPCSSEIIDAINK